MNRLIFKSSISLLFFYFFSCKPDAVRNIYQWHGFTMGTRYEIKICSGNISDEKLNKLRKKIFGALAEINRQMSPFEPESEISKFNRFMDSIPFKTSPEFIRVIKKSLELYNATGGAFDITVAPLIDLWGFGIKGYHEKIPLDREINLLLQRIGSDKIMVIDSLHLKKNIPTLTLNLSAIAKGYGADAVANILRNSGYQDYLVEIGGEVVAHGLNPQRKIWKIGIDKPEYGSFPGSKVESIIALKDAAVATSGDYRNFFKLGGKYYSHTIDPKTGRPVTHNLASVTIIAESCMEADGIATAVMVMGKEKGFTWVESIPEVEALLIVRNKDNGYSEFQTSGFGKYLVSEQNH
jgi:thiamine biosynthesis lipoprotein